MSITISGITGASTHLSGNPIKITATTSGIPAGATQYKILLKVVSTDGLLYGSPFEDATAPDSTGKAIFNISGLVDQHIEKDFAWPIPGLYDGKWSAYSDLVYDIQLYAGERYIDSNGALQESYQSIWGTIFVVKGKLPYHTLKQLNQASSNWFGHYMSGGRWLTFMPVTQHVTPYQPVKLWWKPPTTGLTFVINVKAYYSDGSTDTYADDCEMYHDVMFEFHVHPAGLGFVLDNGVKRLVYYEVWMTGTPDVELRTFIIDWRPMEEIFYLFFDNQIGGIDCVYLDGSASFKPAGEREMVYKPLADGAGIKSRTQYVSGNRRTRRWVINTGFHRRDEIQALEVLLDSTFVWLAIPPMGGSNDLSLYSLTPVIVGNSQITAPPNTDDLQATELEIIEAH